MGLVELRRLPHSDLLHDTAGAFTNIVNWASDAVEFREKAECLADSLGLYVFGVEHEHSVANDMGSAVSEEIADLI